MVNEITDADFKTEVLDEKKVVFVDFWAPWCGPCRMMAPVVEKVSEKYPSVKFCKIDTQENMIKASELSVTGIPCIIVFKDGKEVDRLVGFRSEDDFEKSVKKYAK
ncbi:MAG: thioredoxin [Candidatus Margulisbacteria bacterium]|nr:thioredoxin [Candidatus Margulisiibacteriota bacterium]